MPIARCRDADVGRNRFRPTVCEASRRVRSRKTLVINMASAVISRSLRDCGERAERVDTSYPDRIVGKTAGKFEKMNSKMFHIQ